MMRDSAEKFLVAAQELGLQPNIREFNKTTRTAQEAATAINCEVARIVKSLCFTANDQPVMGLMSGVNQLDTKKLATALQVGRKKVKRADPATVKAATGYTIGGVPPFGHATHLTIYIDADLLAHETIWAAAGSPYAVFEITPTQLVEISNGIVLDLKQDK